MVTTKEEIQTLSLSLGIDMVGFTTCRQLEKKLPEPLRPSRISEYLPVFLVLGKHIPAGIMGAADTEEKPLACSLVHRVLEEASSELAYSLEEMGYMAVLVPSLIMDFKGQTELGNTPAGQSSLLLRLAAVEAGLGTLGVNNMLLTPRYGPRVYLYGLMTNLDVDPDQPIEKELCLGLDECGLCAAVCPADAIPRRAPLESPLSEYRGLDERACARCTQPFGIQQFLEHVQSLLHQGSVDETIAVIEGPTTSQIWYHMAILRSGAFTGCSQCLQVCPVGEDFEQISSSPHRQQDLPEDIQAQQLGNFVEIANHGKRHQAITEPKRNI